MKHFKEFYTEAKSDITIKITDTPKTSDLDSYEGSWNAGVGVTDAQVRAEIKATIKSKIKNIGIFDHTGKQDAKPTPFKGAGTWVAK